MDPIELLAAMVRTLAPATPLAECVERAERALSDVRAHRPPRGLKLRPRRGEEHYAEQFHAVLRSNEWALGRSELLAKVRGNVKRVRAVFEGMLSRGEIIQLGEGRKAGFQLATWTPPTPERQAELLANAAKQQATK